MTYESMHDLYVTELEDLHSAETQTLQTLLRFIKAASSPQLRQALERHRFVTEAHVRRLDQILADLGEQAQDVKCYGMEGLLAEGQNLLARRIEPQVLDAGIIAAAQKVEHYEIAAYGSVRAFAQQLGYREAAATLQQTLAEERDADKTLTHIADDLINPEAADESEEMLTRHYGREPLVKSTTKWQ